MKRIALIDGNSLINRAYYAMRNPMITKDGVYTHAIFGFLNMLDKIRNDYDPEYMAIAFDMKAPTFRHKAYDEYKAGRKKMPPELAMQIPLLKDILDAMKICRIETEGFEADDIIGTMARKAEEEGLEAIIFTGDRDQLQLATDKTKVVYTKKGVSDFDLFDHDSFVEHYGFTPLQFIDFKGLSGDSSDNIPGIPGVGPKTATKLIQDYGSVENIIANAESIKPDGLKKKVEDNAQIAMMSKRLATIHTAVPLDEEISDCLLQEPDYNALIEIYKKLEFNRFLSRLKVSDTAAPQQQEEAADLIDTANYTRTTIASQGELEALQLEGEAVLKVFGDNNHVGTPVMEGAALMLDGVYYYFDIPSLTDFTQWLAAQKLTFIGHDLKPSYYMLMCHGFDAPQTGFDTAIAQYVLDATRKNYSLTALANEYLHYTVEEEKDFLAYHGQMDLFSSNTGAYADYGFSFCTAVLNLQNMQKPMLASEGLEEVFYNIELPLIAVMAGMEKEGFKADRAFLEEFGEKLSGEIETLENSIHEMAGETFNINSPIQLGEILFEKMGLPHGKKTKRGYSTSADVLEKIVGKHPIINAILEYRGLTKLKSTYIDGLIPLINPADGKIHAHFQQTVTATGRISCTEPNLQNIPIRSELGRELRKAFVPEAEECTLVGADYSQIELRVLADMSGDQALIDAFNNGADIHKATAANVLGIPEDQITPAERSRAKAVNFGVIYGMSAFGLSDNLNISRKDANDYIEAYFAKHTAVKQFMDDAVQFCKDNGYVTTIMGRKRYIKEIKATQFMVRQAGERLAMNSPIQGSAADIIKIAMIKVAAALHEAELKSKLILQIHDELIINAYPDELETVKTLLVENMESAYKMKVDLKADLNEGSNWYELK